MFSRSTCGDSQVRNSRNPTKNEYKARSVQRALTASNDAVEHGMETETSLKIIGGRFKSVQQEKEIPRMSSRNKGRGISKTCLSNFQQKDSNISESTKIGSV